MDYILSALLSYLLLYKYVAIFIVVFLSGLALPLPSNTILLAAGAFASQGYMNVTVIFFSALVANVLGDSLAFALTRFWGTRIITQAVFSRYKTMSRINAFIREHQGLTITATRFIGTAAVFVNFLSGLIRIPYRSFVLYDCIGNALDTACFLFIGYILGAYVENYSDIATLIGAIVLIGALICIALKLFLNKTKGVL